jgi:hypothetical protein
MDKALAAMRDQLNRLEVSLKAKDGASLPGPVPSQQSPADSQLPPAEVESGAASEIQVPLPSASVEEDKPSSPTGKSTENPIKTDSTVPKAANRSTQYQEYIREVYRKAISGIKSNRLFYNDWETRSLESGTSLIAHLGLCIEIASSNHICDLTIDEVEVKNFDGHMTGHRLQSTNLYECVAGYRATVHITFSTIQVSMERVHFLSRSVIAPKGHLAELLCGIEYDLPRIKEEAEAFEHTAEELEGAIRCILKDLEKPMLVVVDLRTAALDLICRHIFLFDSHHHWCTLGLDRYLHMSHSVMPTRRDRRA